MTYLITTGNVVTWGEVPQFLPNYALYIDEGRIQDMGPTATMLAQYPDVEQMDAGGQLVMPGNICAHTHFYGAYARGMAIAGPPPADFPAILRQLWWPLDQALDRDSIRASARVMLVDAIKHGTTTLFDHHASANAIENSLNIIGQAVDQAGLRAVLAYEVSDRHGIDGVYAGIAENLRFIEAAHSRRRLAGAFGLHASLTLSDDALKLVADAAPAEVGYHIHLGEHEIDQKDSLRRSNQRVVPRLAAHDIWRPNTIAAHGVHIDADERKMLQAAGVWLSHQPRSNMNNGVGAMAFDAMMEEGLRVCLGNDGLGNNMLAEWKAAYLLHKVAQRDPRAANGAAIAQMATRHNADLARLYFPGSEVGELKVGAVADIIFVDYHPYTPLNADNLPWHLLFGFEASMVTTTIVDGAVLMRDRRLLTLDEAAVTAEAMTLAPAVWERYRRIAENSLQ